VHRAGAWDRHHADSPGRWVDSGTIKDIVRARPIVCLIFGTNIRRPVGLLIPQLLTGKFSALSGMDI